MTAKGSVRSFRIGLEEHVRRDAEDGRGQDQRPEGVVEGDAGEEAGDRERQRVRDPGEDDPPKQGGDLTALAAMRAFGQPTMSSIGSSVRAVTVKSRARLG